MAFPPNFTRAWDETFPPDTQAANLLGQDLRNGKSDLRERMALLSGTFANRPTPDAVFGGAGYGVLYFSTDTNQLFQWNGAAWVILGFSTNILASVNLLLQNTNLGPTVLFNAVNAGMYRINSDLICSVAGGTGSVALTLNWNNGLLARSTTINTLNFANTLGNELLSTPFDFYSAAAQNISYQVGFSPTATEKYDLRLRLEYLG